MFARRIFLRGLAAGLLTLAMSSNGSAAGKGNGKGGGNNGNGNGNGGSNGNGGGNSGNGNGNGGGNNDGGNGNGGGNNGNGNGNSGNNGNGNGNSGNGKGKGVGNKATATATEKPDVAAPSSLASPAAMSPTTSSLRVRHRNGFEEIMSGGRYHLKDNQGRTIVNRPATKTDLARLRRLTGA